MQEVSNMISLNKFLSLCFAECVNYAQVRQPKSSLSNEPGPRFSSTPKSRAMPEAVESVWTRKRRK